MAAPRRVQGLLGWTAEEWVKAVGEEEKQIKTEQLELMWQSEQYRMAQYFQLFYEQWNGSEEFDKVNDAANHWVTSRPHSQEDRDA